MIWFKLLAACLLIVRIEIVFTSTYLDDSLAIHRDDGDLYKLRTSSGIGPGFFKLAISGHRHKQPGQENGRQTRAPDILMKYEPASSYSHSLKRSLDGAPTPFQTIKRMLQSVIPNLESLAGLSILDAFVADYIKIPKARPDDLGNYYFIKARIITIPATRASYHIKLFYQPGQPVQFRGARVYVDEVSLAPF